MHLKQYTTLIMPFLHFFIHCNHRHFHNIRRRTLNRRIHRCPFRKRSAIIIRTSDIRQRPISPKKRHRTPGFFCIFHHFFHKFVNMRIAFQIFLNIIACRFSGDIQLFCQAETANSINNTEINRFRMRSFFCRYLVKRFS